MKYLTDNVRITSSAPMVAPNTLISKYPLSEQASQGVYHARQVIKDILFGEDKRLMVLALVQFMTPKRPVNTLKSYRH